MWTDTKLKKIYGWQINTWKDAQHYQLSGKHKLKPQSREFPGSPVVRTAHFHCQGPRFNPGQRTKILHDQKTDHIKTLLAT